MILFNVSVIFPVKPTRPSAEPFPDAFRRAGPRGGGRGPVGAPGGLALPLGRGLRLLPGP